MKHLNTSKCFMFVSMHSFPEISLQQNNKLQDGANTAVVKVLLRTTTMAQASLAWLGELSSDFFTKWNIFGWKPKFLINIFYFIMRWQMCFSSLNFFIFPAQSSQWFTFNRDTSYKKSPYCYQLIAIFTPPNL